MRALAFFTAAAAAVVAVPAAAATYVVDAAANSSSGGTGLASITLAAGQSFTVSSSTDDLWSAGPLPRFSDGDGLGGDRFATASDDSGQAPGTQIGANFGTWTQNGLTTQYGRLVGEIGGSFLALGANGTFTATQSGVLNLYYWDSNNGDNSGSISFDIAAVPEPATWALMIGGIGVVGAGMRRRRSVTLATA